MSLEKDIRDLTAAINNLAAVVRETAQPVIVNEAMPAMPDYVERLAALAAGDTESEIEAWQKSPPGTPAPLSAREPYDVKAVTAKQSAPETIVLRNDEELGAHNAKAWEEASATALTFEQVKQVFLDIARGAPDPMEGSKRSRAVLAKYGAAKLKDVEEAKWPAFVEDCRAAAAVAA